MWNDLKHGARMLVKNPGFAIIAILSIGIGVGANAAMFSLADGLVLRPLQVPRAGEIISVSAISPRATASFLANNGVSNQDFRDLQRATSFNGLFAYQVTIAGLAARTDEPPQTALGLNVSGNFFDVLELRPALGRFFLPDEDRVPNRDAVMVLSHDVWKDRFGGDPGVLGRHVRLSGVDYSIIGVAPEGFDGMHLALHPIFYVPLAMSGALPGAPPNALERRDMRFLIVKGRLKSGVSLEQARAEATTLAASLEKSYPDTNKNYGLLVRTDFDARLEERGPSAPSAFMLMTLAFVVLLVACANVAGLLISRGPAREREIALRLAIGGGRGRVTRQLITESVLLAVGGGALGLAIGYAAVLVLRQLPIVSDIGVRLIFTLDRRAVGVGVVLAAASAILSSLVPAWRAARSTDLARTLKIGTDNGRSSRQWGRSGLVAGQIALSVILLTVTVFLARAFQAQLQQPGFRTTHMLLTNFEPRLARYTSLQSVAFYRALKDRVRALPGVTAVGMTSVMPLNQDVREPIATVPEGFQLPTGTESISLLSTRIDPGYLGAMNVAVIRGRGIDSRDVADAPPVVLVNQTMAARYWPGQDAIGKRIRLTDREGQPFAEIVGITADTKQNFIAEGPSALLYIAQEQDPGFRSTLIVATRGDSAALASSVRTIVRELDPGMPISGIRTMEEFYYGNAIGVVTVLMSITAWMGVLGLVLAMIGLYGLVAFVVARQTREIGIRMAMGAQRGTVLRMILRHGFIRAGWGVAFGIVGCMGVVGVLQGLFPSIGSIDVSTYIVVIALLVLVTILAAYIPARRAARIDPLRALRTE